MTKALEMEHLRAFIASLPKDTYLRPWLEENLLIIERDITDDFCISPTSLAGANPASTTFFENSKRMNTPQIESPLRRIAQLAILDGRGENSQDLANRLMEIERIAIEASAATPKILISINSGIAKAVCATADVTVEIVDMDSQDNNGFPTIGSEALQGRDEARYRESFLECLPDCAECGKTIEHEADNESTYCGSIHHNCMEAHAKHCEVCKKDFAERG
jgi:hypothetical protein